jgi:hypothetical protein
LIFYVLLIYLNQGDVMKYIVIVLLSCLVASCSPFGLNPKGYEKLDENLSIAWGKTSSYKYISEAKGKQYWKSPKQFEADGGGDCEDFTGHLMYYLGEGEAIVVTYKRDGKEYCHCIVRLNGKYLEPQSIGKYYDLNELGWKIVDEYSWNEYMAMITDFGMRNL